MAIDFHKVGFMK